jgi:hypothetical protein
MIPISACRNPAASSQEYENQNVVFKHTVGLLFKPPQGADEKHEFWLKLMNIRMWSSSIPSLVWLAHNFDI